MNSIIAEQMSEEQTRQVWVDYRARGDERTRERLIINYLPLVKQVVGRMIPALPKHLMTDELLSAGVLGLMDAVEKFDPHSGTKFETYARQRIWGAVVDELRKCDWAPRSLRRKARTVAQAYSSLEQELGRSATSQEVGEYLSMDPGEVDALMAKSSNAAVLSLNARQVQNEDGQSIEMVDTLGDERAEPPDQRVLSEEMRETLEQGIKDLNEQERMVIVLYYYEELMLKEIGAILGVSESRVSQIHTKSIQRLKSRLTTTAAAL